MKKERAHMKHDEPKKSLKYIPVSTTIITTWKKN